MANLGVKKSSFASLDPSVLDLTDATSNPADLVNAVNESLLKGRLHIPIMEEIVEHEIVSPIPVSLPEHL